MNRADAKRFRDGIKDMASTVQQILESQDSSSEALADCISEMAEWMMNNLEGAERGQLGRDIYLLIVYAWGEARQRYGVGDKPNAGPSEVRAEVEDSTEHSILSRHSAIFEITESYHKQHPEWKPEATPKGITRTMMRRIR